MIYHYFKAAKQSRTFKKIENGTIKLLFKFRNEWIGYDLLLEIVLYGVLVTRL